MKSKLITRIVVSLVVLFGLGGLCGYAMSTQIHKARPGWTQNPDWTRRWIERRMAEDFARIGATPEQQEQLRSSYERLRTDFNAIQAESSAKVRDAFRRHGAELRRQLTPEQRELLRPFTQQPKKQKAEQP